MRAVPAVAMLFVAAALPLAAAIAAPATPPLIDQTGRTFTLPSLQGRPLIVTFVSAHCTDACPLVDGQFAAAAERIAQQRLSTRLLTVTLDPRHDTPQTMRALARRFDADPRYWLLASGSVRNVNAVLSAFGVVAEPGKDGFPDAHSTFVYVFDARGTLNKTMLASTNLTDDIVARARAFVPRPAR